MKDFRMQWSRAFGVVCEVGLIEGPELREREIDNVNFEKKKAWRREGNIIHC